MLLGQITMVSLEELVSQDHQYRKFKMLFNFKVVEEELLALECGGNIRVMGY